MNDAFLRNEKKLDLSNFLLFERFPIYIRLIDNIISTFIANDFKVEILYEPLKEVFAKDDDTKKEFNSILKNLLINALPKIVGLGFVSWTSSKDNPYEIKCLDYSNSNMSFVVGKDNEIELIWRWKNPMVSNNLLVINDNNKIKHYMESPPTFGGKLTGKFSKYIIDYIELRKMSEIEKRKESLYINPKPFIQKRLPDLRPEYYDIFQKHTAMANAQADDVDDSNKRFFNLHQMTSSIEIHEPDWADRTKERIAELFKIKNYYTVKKIQTPFGESLEAGELSELRFFPPPKTTTTYDQMFIRLKTEMEESVGIFLHRTKALKEHAQIASWLMNSPAISLQAISEKFLNEIANRFYGKTFSKRLREDEFEGPILKIEIDRIQFMPAQFMELLMEGGVSIDKIIKVGMGDEFSYLIPQKTISDKE